MGGKEGKSASSYEALLEPFLLKRIRTQVSTDQGTRKWMVWYNSLRHDAFSDASLNIVYFLHYDLIKHLIPCGIQNQSPRPNIATICDAQLKATDVHFLLVSVSQEYRCYLAGYFFFFFSAFLGPLPWHIEVPRLGAELEL